MAATNPGAGAGNFLTRKLGPLPMWAWIGIGVAVAYWYKQRQAASSSTTTAGTAALAAQGANAVQYGYSGADLASMLEQLQAQVSGLGAGNSGTTSSAAVSPGNTMTGAANQLYSKVPDAATEQRLLRAGAALYYQAAPGVYEALPKSAYTQVLTPKTPWSNTQLYVSVPSSGPQSLYTGA